MWLSIGPSLTQNDHLVCAVDRHYAIKTGGSCSRHGFHYAIKTGGSCSRHGFNVGYDLKNQRLELSLPGHTFVSTISAAELASWTPLALNLEAPTPSVNWGDFGCRRFMEPFFEDTVAAWAAQNPPPRLVSTDLEALVILDQAPSLDPSGFIFHLSRCGSTLLARLLQQVPGCVVVSEPEIINQLLLTDAALVDYGTRVRLLRLLVRALGRRRFGDERHYIMKLSSWNVRKLDLFCRAFPATPLVWLQRNPAEVIASLLAHSPRWVQLQGEPELAGSLFDMPAEEVTTLKPVAFYANALAALFKAARSAPAGVMLTIDYSDLPAAAWTTIGPLFGLTPNVDEIALMQTKARYYSKDTTPRVFERRRDASNTIPETVRLLAAVQLDLLYRELNDRKPSKQGPPLSSALRE